MNLQTLIYLFILWKMDTVLVHSLPIIPKTPCPKCAGGLEKPDAPPGDFGRLHLEQVDNTSSSSKLQHPSKKRLFKSRHGRKKMSMLKEAKAYLHKYGYIENGASPNEVNKAIKLFQEIAGVKPTGHLGTSTIVKMRQQRCAIGDDRIDSRLAQKKKSKRFVQVSKWTGKMDSQDVLRLKWKIGKYSNKIPPYATSMVAENAFKVWSDQATIPSMRTLKLDFSESKEQTDIEIIFASGDHGDGYPFDGAGNSSNILAHTFYPNYQPFDPLNGDIHFDDAENWTLDPYAKSSESYFPYVLVHEIGHSLGLGHSKRQEAIMNPIYKTTPLSKITLDIDDKCALNWNYIGPSNVCLFVWLMVELLPLSKNITFADMNKKPLSMVKEMAPHTQKGQKFNKHKLERLLSSVIDNEDWQGQLCESDEPSKNLVKLANDWLSIPYQTSVNIGKSICKLIHTESTLENYDKTHRLKKTLCVLLLMLDISRLAMIYVLLSAFSMHYAIEA